MTETHDNERIARLTELAQRVWPGYDIGVSEGIGDDDEIVGAAVTLDPLGEWQQAIACGHPRALDAIEAALRTLAGEPSAESFAALDRYRESEAKLVEDARAHRRLREGVEKLRNEIRAELPCTGEYVHIGVLLDEFDALLDSPKEAVP